MLSVEGRAPSLVLVCADLERKDTYEIKFETCRNQSNNVFRFWEMQTVYSSDLCKCLGAYSVLQISL